MSPVFFVFWSDFGNTCLSRIHYIFFSERTARRGIDGIWKSWKFIANTFMESRFAFWKNCSPDGRETERPLAFLWIRVNFQVKASIYALFFNAKRNLIIKRMFSFLLKRDGLWAIRILLLLYLIFYYSCNKCHVPFCFIEKRRMWNILFYIHAYSFTF